MKQHLLCAILATILIPLIAMEEPHYLIDAESLINNTSLEKFRSHFDNRTNPRKLFKKLRVCVCGQTFVSYQKLVKHIDEHCVDNLYACKHCPFIANKLKLFMLHMLHHTQEAITMCTGCLQPLNKRSFYYHQDVHEKNGSILALLIEKGTLKKAGIWFQCPSCPNNQYVKLSDLLLHTNHMHTCSNIAIPEYIKNPQLITITAPIIQHLSEIDPMMFNCSERGLSISVKLSPIKNRVSDLNLETDHLVLFKEVKNGEILLSIGNIQRILETISKNVRVCDCGYTPKSYYFLQKHVKHMHLKNNTDGFVCPKGDYSTPLLHMFILHLLEHTQEDIHMCSKCLIRVENSEKAIKEHFDAHVTYPQILNHVIQDYGFKFTNKGFFLCPICKKEKIFEFLANLLKHINTQHPIKKSRKSDHLNDDDIDPQIIIITNNIVKKLISLNSQETSQAQEAFDSISIETIGFNMADNQIIPCGLLPSMDEFIEEVKHLPHDANSGLTSNQDNIAQEIPDTITLTKKRKYSPRKKKTISEQEKEESEALEDDSKRQRSL